MVKVWNLIMENIMSLLVLLWWCEEISWKTLQIEIQGTCFILSTIEFPTKICTYFYYLVVRRYGFLTLTSYGFLYFLFFSNCSGCLQGHLHKLITSPKIRPRFLPLTLAQWYWRQHLQVDQHTIFSCFCVGSNHFALRQISNLHHTWL